MTRLAEVAFGQSPVGQVASDWPTGLLLDELWLRCRRELVHGLERAGLWVTGGQYQRVIDEQGRYGHRLAATVLLPAFSAEEAALWQSDAVFDRRRFDRRLPLVMAFGSAVVGLLAGMHGRPLGPDHPNRQAGALFNLGISLVDTLVDERAEAARKLTGWLDADRLAELCRHRPSDHHSEYVDGLPLSETRLVLRVVLAFFATVHTGLAGTDPADTDPEPADPVELAGLLRQAYAAELASGAVGGSGPRWAGSRNEAGDASSRVPFLVLGWLARAVAPDPAAGAASLLGEVFAALDDLVDLVDDLRSGAVNQLAAGDIGAPVSIERLPCGYQLLDELVTGEAVGHQAATLVTRLARVRDLVAASGGPADALTPLLCYVRNWLE